MYNCLLGIFCIYCGLFNFWTRAANSKMGVKLKPPASDIVSLLLVCAGSYLIYDYWKKRKNI